MRGFISHPISFTTCGASSERNECLTWVRLADGQPRKAHTYCFLSWLLHRPTQAHHLTPRRMIVFFLMPQHHNNVICSYVHVEIKLIIVIVNANNGMTRR